MANLTSTRRPWSTVGTFLLMAGLATSAWYLSQHPSTATPSPRTGYEMTDVPPAERKETFQQALEDTRALSSTCEWPETDSDLVQAFWNEVLQNNLDKATAYAPGTMTRELEWFRRAKPTKATVIGKPAAHPQHPDVMQVPVQIEFTRLPHKTLRTAVVRLPDGRRVIHGEHSQWW